jgi:hypothetical protein
MSEEEFNDLIKALREEQKILGKKYNNQDFYILIMVMVEAPTGEFMAVNPFDFDLKSKKCFGRDLRNNRLKWVSLK